MASFKSIVLCAALWVALSPAGVLNGQTPSGAREPDSDLAKLWWPDQRNVFTPVSWKEHYFRFNVLYNGTLLFDPLSNFSSRVNARPFAGQDFQVSFTPWPDTNTPALPTVQVPLWKLDGGHGLQGWRTNGEAPVLWTDFPCQEGLVIRQEVFSHLKGGGDVVTGLEPLYAWIRLTVTHVDPFRAPAKFPMVLQLSRNYHVFNLRFLHENGLTIDVQPERAPYPRPLAGDAFAEGEKTGLFVTEPDGKVRFAMLPSSAGRAQFYERAKGIYGLKVDMLAKVGDSVDFLMPMFPQPRPEVEAEMKLGFDGALAQTEAFWRRNLRSTATFHVPEDYINRVVAQNVKFAAMNSEKDYKTGEYALLTGAWGYDQLWPTPVSMNEHMLLSLLGYHDMVERYSEIYRIHQGELKPPGPGYTKHPGYFGSPTNLTSFDWITDHGAILLQISTHARLCGDKKTSDQWVDSIIKACEFIRDACAQTNHNAVIGLLPPAVATDEIIPTQAIWSLAWNYKGLVSAVQFLKQINHPRADEFDAVARKYKSVFVKAYRETAASAPRWKDAAGREHVKPPTTLSKTPMPWHPFSDAFYLDGGPLVLVWAGLMDADDPLMRDTVLFFREGPNWKLRGPRVNAISRPVLEHEVSTCEPCYSFNVYHSWQLGDRERFLEGLYSLFTAAISHQTYSGSEHRTGLADQVAVASLGFSIARLAVIDDQIKDKELHLLRLCPTAWLSSTDEAVFENMPTVYGPVTLKCLLSADKKTLNVTLKGDWREKPQKVVLHTPPVPGLRKIVVNGKSFRAGGDILWKD